MSRTGGLGQRISPAYVENFTTALFATPQSVSAVQHRPAPSSMACAFAVQRAFLKKCK